MSLGGGKTESKEESWQKSPEQQEWMTKALELYGPTLGKGQEPYPGERIAPLTETQTEALDLQGFLDTFASYRDMPMFGETGEALDKILSGEYGAEPITQEMADEYFNRVIADPEYRKWEKYTKPGIREEYAGPGYWSGARARAVTGAGTELSNWLGEQRAQLGWDVEQENRAIEEAKAGRALSALAPSMEYSQLETREAADRLRGREDVFRLSGEEQAQRQREIDADIQRFAEELRLTNPEDLQILLSLLGMDYGAAKGSSSGWDIGIGFPAPKA